MLLMMLTLCFLSCITFNLSDGVTSVMVSTLQKQSNVTSTPTYRSLPVVITAAGYIFHVTSPSISRWIFYVPSSPTYADRAQISSVLCIYIIVNDSVFIPDASYPHPHSFLVTYGFPGNVHVDRIYWCIVKHCLYTYYIISMQSNHLSVWDLVNVQHKYP